MKFGCLSEEEVKKITGILDRANIKYAISSDQEVIDNNTNSMQDNLRHYRSPSISTSVLAIEVADDALSNIDSETKEQLLEFGITNEVPEELFEPNQQTKTVHQEMQLGKQRMIGFSFKHQLLLAILIGIIFFLYDLIFKQN